MPDNDGVFADDWRESLRAHYREVVRRNDKATEDTLTGVLHDVGFQDEELRQLKLEATMRTEDLHDDFVPELTLDDTSSVYPGADVTPADEVQTPDAPETVLADEPAELDESDDEAGPEASEDDDSDGETFQQMSLF